MVVLLHCCSKFLLAGGAPQRGPSRNLFFVLGLFSSHFIGLQLLVSGCGLMMMIIIRHEYEHSALAHVAHIICILIHWRELSLPLVKGERGDDQLDARPLESSPSMIMILHFALVNCCCCCCCCCCPTRS